MEMTYHKPVMLEESVQGLNLSSNGTYVDTTFGGGGHSRAILEELSESGKLFAFDQDADAQKNSVDDPRFVLIPQNFKYLLNFLKLYGALPVQGILADLGVSSHQFDTASRGFSIRFEGPLDMRMNQSQEASAATILNTYAENDLADLFFNYGELKNARKIARKICEIRAESEFETIEELKSALQSFAPRNRGKQVLRSSISGTED